MKLSCLVFDVDGTLVDNANLIIQLFQDIVLKYLGRKITKQEVISLWGPPGDEIFKSVFPSDILTPAWNEFLSRYNTIHPTEGFFTIDQLNDMKKNVQHMAIFTGKSRKTMVMTLQKLGLIDVFDIILTGNDVERSKPYPDALFRIINVLSLDKTETLFIGDSPLDIMAGKSAGIKTAAALWGTIEESKLIESNPDYVFKTPEELLNFVVTS